MSTSIPAALSTREGVGGGVTESFDHNMSLLHPAEGPIDDSSIFVDPILYPKGATIFAAICASLFTVVGIGGKIFYFELLAQDFANDKFSKCNV